MAGKNDNQAVEAVRKTARFAANDVSRGHRPLFATRFRGENAIVVSVQAFGLDRPPARRTFVQQRDVNNQSTPANPRIEPGPKVPHAQRENRCRKLTPVSLETADLGKELCPVGKLKIARAPRPEDGHRMAKSPANCLRAYVDSGSSMRDSWRTTMTMPESVT